MKVSPWVRKCFRIPCAKRLELRVRRGREK
jgi:hypothetical protein